MQKIWSRKPESPNPILTCSSQNPNANSSILHDLALNLVCTHSVWSMEGVRIERINGNGVEYRNWFQLAMEENEMAILLSSLISHQPCIWASSNPYIGWFRPIPNFLESSNENLRFSCHEFLISSHLTYQLMLYLLQKLVLLWKSP